MTDGLLRGSGHGAAYWAADLLLHGVAAVHPPSTAFDPEALLQVARRRTGLTDAGDGRFQIGLRALCRSFEEDAGLSQIGRVVMREIVIQKLSNRLRIQTVLAAHPEIRHVPVPRPLFIVGLARSGTTMLHRLLSSPGRLRSLRLWEVWTPAPPPDPDTSDRDPRRAAPAAYSNSEATGIGGLVCRHLDKLLGRENDRAKQAIHEWDNDLPEECTHLFMNDFLSCEFAVIAHVAGYMDWLYRQDHAASYRYYREQLQLLTWRFPPRRLLLKSPSHVRGLAALFEVFPDSRVVWLHRDPQAAIPSVCSLVEASVRQTTHRPRPEKLGATQVAYALHDLRGGMAADAAEPGRILHVAYRALLRDPMGVLSAIHDFADLPFDGHVVEAMSAWLRDNPQHKRGVHTYELHRFGLTPEAIEEAFRQYIDTYQPFLRD